MEGAIKRLWGQSRTGHFSHRQGAVFLCCSGKSDVDGRHHGTDRMGWAQVRHLSGSFLYNLLIFQLTVFSSSVKRTGTLAGMGNPVLQGPWSNRVFTYSTDVTSSSVSSCLPQTTWLDHGPLRTGLPVSALGLLVPWRQNSISVCQMKLVFPSHNTTVHLQMVLSYLWISKHYEMLNTGFVNIFANHEYNYIVL